MQPLVHAHPRHRRPTVFLALGATVLALSACSGDDAEEPGVQDPTSAAPGAVATSVDPAKVSPEDLAEAPELRGARGAVKDATFGECATTKGRTTVEGSITSSARKKADYVVTVSWVNATSDVLGRGVTVLRDLAPGAEQEFSIAATVPDGATTCTFRVERGQVR